MSAAYRPGASNSALYAAALFASENGARQQAQTLLARIPGGSQTSDMRDLRQRVNYNLQLVTAENHRRRAIPSPPAIPCGRWPPRRQSPGGRRQAGASAGRERRPDHRGLAGAQQYQQRRIRQCRGLRRSDRCPESGRADRRGAEPDQQSAAAGQQYADAAGEHSQWLCDQRSRPPARAGNYAAAYDKLIRAMQSDPQNTDLMFAMARLYQSGKMNKEAGVVYDYLMTRDTPNQMRAPGPSTWRCRRGTTIALNSWPAVCAR